MLQRTPRQSIITSMNVTFPIRFQTQFEGAIRLGTLLRDRSLPLSEIAAQFQASSAECESGAS